MRSRSHTGSHLSTTPCGSKPTGSLGASVIGSLTDPSLSLSIPGRKKALAGGLAALRSCVLSAAREGAAGTSYRHSRGMDVVAAPEMAAAPLPVPRRTLVHEVWVVFALSLGASGVYSLVHLIADAT